MSTKKMMTREEFQETRFPDGPALYNKFVCSGMTQKQANTERMRILEEKYQAYLTDEAERIRGIEI